jgi:hypothetical protein
MKMFASSHRAVWLAALCGGFVATSASAQNNFDVSNVGFQYSIDGANNTGTAQGTIQGIPTNNCPPLVLTAGTTNTFVISVDATHPLKIVTNSPGPLATGFTGASPQGLTTGTMTLIIPATNYPSSLYYECSRHFFYGTITIVPPSAGAPPQNAIISILVTPTGVTVTSTGTNTTYTLVPQFDSNVINGAWQDVPAFTNNFNNGSNVTTFGRLDAECGSNVFLRISQRP